MTHTLRTFCATARNFAASSRSYLPSAASWAEHTCVHHNTHARTHAEEVEVEDTNGENGRCQMVRLPAFCPIRRVRDMQMRTNGNISFFPSSKHTG